jgi:HD-GYP domain-containing protein (c-di-GMP phosphodiesterase class II)
MYISLTGGGIHDPVVLAYPILVFIGGLMFGKRYLPVFILASAASLALIGWIGMRGAMPGSLQAGVSDILTQVILVAAEGFLVWMTLELLEKNYQRAERSEAELNESYNMTLEGWVKALEFRDRETEGHCRRVASMCVQLSYQLGLTRDEVITIYRGALLHDIGKMAIPDSILFKPGPLTEAEWELMRQHPIYARQMLEEIPFLNPSIPIPFCHHERWDGSGYPRGLKNEEIPLPARIFTVVDHWEALSSDRPYRRALPPELVSAYIEENSGVIFDPEIAGLFLRMMASPDFPLRPGDPEADREPQPVSIRISARL